MTDRREVIVRLGTDRSEVILGLRAHEAGEREPGA